MTGTVLASKRLRGRDEEHSGSGDFVFFDDDGAIVERGADIEDGLKKLWGDWSVHVNAALLAETLEVAESEAIGYEIQSAGGTSAVFQP